MKQDVNSIISAVKASRYHLNFVKEKDQTPEICLEAVKSDGLALEYVKNQTIEICFEAVKQNNQAFKFVDTDLKLVTMNLMHLHSKYEKDMDLLIAHHKEFNQYLQDEALLNSTNTEQHEDALSNLVADFDKANAPKVESSNNEESESKKVRRDR